MKTLKAIMAIAMVIILASCGGKSFDHERAKEMTEAYEDGDFSDNDWKEFCSLYEDGADYLIDMMETTKTKITPDMTIKEVNAIKEEFEEIYSIWDRMDYPIYDARREIPDNLSERFKAADEKVSKMRREFNASIAEGNPVYKVLGLEKENRYNENLTPKEYWKKYSDFLIEAENIINGKSDYKPTQAQIAEIQRIIDDHKSFIEMQAKDLKMGTPETALTELTSKGLGVIALGAKAAELPNRIDGFYDNVRFEQINHEYNLDVPLIYSGYYTFSIKGNPIAHATVDKNGKIVSISVMSSEYASPDGITVGDPYSKISSDTRFRPSNNEMTDNMQSDNCVYVHDFNKICSIIIGDEY